MVRRRTRNDQTPNQESPEDGRTDHDDRHQKYEPHDRKSTDRHGNTRDNICGQKLSDEPERKHSLTETAIKGEKHAKSKERVTLSSLLGFSWEEVTSWERFVRLLNRPCDPASLGTLRFLFGLLMVVDCVTERGFATVDWRWEDREACRFPLFNFLHPLPLVWMVMVYFSMFVGATGIMLGFRFRLSCLLYLGPYWYIFFLDKTTWNNHSYLFGIMAFLFSISDANRYWSVDALLDPALHNKHVPLWNYTLIRAQIFLLYFIAGLKKLDMDWMSGYSMKDLSSNWVFDPFKVVLTEAQIDLFIIHLGGLTIDLSLGFLLLFDGSRPLGLLISSSFHTMNSQIFSIGMFPYACMATQLVFCAPRWPRRVFSLLPPALRILTPDDGGDLQPSAGCLYLSDTELDDDTLEPTYNSNKNKQSTSSSAALTASPASFRHKTATVFTCLFISWQCFLPYSHGITKGYNTWTNGLYGYSWDMMVHSWYVQHIRVTYVDKATGESGYLDPKVWGSDRRWSSHVDMIKQFASCASENLRTYGIKDAEIYLDIWRSLNHRFQQRVVNPNIDMVTAEWNPFKEPPWLLPLMTGLSDWRGKLEEIESGLQSDDSTEVVFVADFPGLLLENYVQPDFSNTSLTVLNGQVIVELIDDSKNITLGSGDSTQIPSDTFHNVYTVSSDPSCYMYIFVNTTDVEYRKLYSEFEKHFNETSLNKTLEKFRTDPYLEQFNNTLHSMQKMRSYKFNFWDEMKTFLYKKYKLWVRCIRLVYGATISLSTNNSFKEYLKVMNDAENSVIV